MRVWPELTFPPDQALTASLTGLNNSWQGLWVTWESHYCVSSYKAMCFGKPGVCQGRGFVSVHPALSSALLSTVVGEWLLLLPMTTWAQTCLLRYAVFPLVVQCEMSPTGLHVLTLGTKLMVLIGKVVELSWSGTLLVEVSHWKQALRFHSWTPPSACAVCFLDVDIM